MDFCPYCISVTSYEIRSKRNNCSRHAFPMVAMFHQGQPQKQGLIMDSILDSVSWEDGAYPRTAPRRPRSIWLKRALLLLCTVAALGVLLSR